MKETGLMFKAPLVRSILRGQKPRTRCICMLDTVKDEAFVGGHCLKLKDGMDLAMRAPQAEVRDKSERNSAVTHACKTQLQA